MNFVSRLLACGVLLAAGWPAVPAHAQTRWDLPTAYSDSTFHTENLARFAVEVDRATSGRLKIMLHTNASLFKAPEIKRAVQGGQAQIGEILLSNHAGENPVYGLDSLPFLATSYNEAHRLYEAQRPVLEKLLAAQGMKLLFAVAWPPQGLFSRDEVGSMADLRGLKWRAYSPATVRMAELAGAEPVQVQASELPRALSGGLVDCFMSSGWSGLDTRSYVRIKHFYDMQAWLPKNAVIANLDALVALEAPVRDALLRVAAEAELRGWQISQARNAQYRSELTQRGMNVHQPSHKLMADMQHVGDTLLSEWEKVAGADGRRIVDDYRRSAAR